MQDIAVIMGIVPEDQSLLRLEDAGVVRRVGKNASAYRVGQRVIISMKDCFANRVLCPTDCAYPLPDSMSFEVKGRFVYIFVFGLNQRLDTGSGHHRVGLPRVTL